MILRKGDWRHYPGAIVHNTTKNKHFIKFARTLMELGVAHYYIHLALHNPALADVDPFDPHLTAQQQAWIIEECAVNPWYYFRECVRIPADGTDGVPFRIDRGNFAMYWIFFNNIDAAVEFLRQHGKTIGICALESWLMRFLENSRTIHVTKGPILREETITTLKRIRDGLPAFLWPHHPDDPDNKESFACLAQGNKLITAIGQNDIASANGVGRGLTAGRLISDEGPFTNNVHHILPAAFGSGTAARRINEEKGVPYGNVIATTPGDLATDEGRYIHELMTSGIMWDERYLDIPSRLMLIDLILKNAASEKPRILFYVKLNHLQLGTSNEELARMISNATGTRDQILRDYGGTWTTGGLNKPYSEEDASRMNKSRMNPVFKEISNTGYVMDWFYEEHQVMAKMSVRHIIGLDTSEAVGRDAIAFTMINSETGETAAKLKVKETNVIGFANWMALFMIKYRNTVLILERRSTGSSVADAILMVLQNKIRDLHRRIYVRITQDASRYDDLFNEFRRGPGAVPERFWDKFRKYIGFSTDQDKRRKLYGEVFTMALRVCAHLIRAPELIDEILSLVERNGRIDHVRSGHDDLVISWLLAMWLLIFGKNLSHYEISNHRLMIRHRLGTEGGSQQDEDKLVREEEEQKILMAEIEAISREVQATRCPVKSMALRSKLQSLVGDLNTDLGNVASMESLKELLVRQRMK